MAPIREQHLVGLDYLAAVTTLLQRIRGAHPTTGLYEAADLQWWWRLERATDTFPQLFWLGDDDRPAAAVIATAWGDRISLDPMIPPGTDADGVTRVMEQGLAHAAAAGFDAISLEVDPADVALRDVLVGHGFAIDDDGLVETWMDADARAPISPLAEGYRLSSRAETGERPHHLTNAGRNPPNVEARLRQTSLYRPDLDLVVHDGDGNVAAYGLFWHDAVTATGSVEPMRTEDDHQQRGLARHVLTAGVDLLARAGAERIKICYEPANPASGHLYRSVGFVPVRQTVVYARRPDTRTASSSSATPNAARAQVLVSRIRR